MEKSFHTEKDSVDKEWLKLTLDKYYHPEKYFTPEEIVIKPTFGELFDSFLEKHPLSEVRKKNFRVIKRAILRYELYVRTTKRGQKDFVLDVDTVTPETLRDMWDFSRTSTDTTSFIRPSMRLFPKEDTTASWQEHPDRLLFKNTHLLPVVLRQQADRQQTV